jgi:leucyl aminopeptidase
MRVSRTTSSPADAKVDLLIVPIPVPAKDLPKEAKALDRTLRGSIAASVADREISGRAGSMAVIHSGGRVAAPRIAVVSVGTGDLDGYRTAGHAAGKRAKALGAKSVAVVTPADCPADASCALEGIGLGAYRFDRFRGAPEKDAPKRNPLGKLSLIGGQADRADISWTQGMVDAVNGARDLANTPANHMTPTDLAAHALARADGIAGLTCEVLDRDAIAALGMNSFLSVSQGSAEPPKLIVMRWRPAAPATTEVLGLVGKAVTFDTGGISIKPAGGMDEMKMDMAGGAAVIEAISLIAAQKLAVEVLAVVPATENMPSGTAIKPGDVVTAMNGKTIENRNTDAEGRLILADALTYCARNGASRMVDIATLTGAIVVALGEVYTGLFGSDDEWTDAVRAAGDAGGDICWPMPMHPGYDPLIRSKVADLANAATKRQAGPIYAAQFLREFTDGLPWCHLDIAGTGMAGGAATGTGVRLFAELARSMASA